MRALLAGVTVFAVGLAQSAAWSDELTRPLAASGAWLAIAHSPSEIAPPDVCLVANTASNVAFRADRDRIEFRVIDDSWSLPPGVHGTISVQIGTYSKDFDIAWNEHNFVAVIIAPTDVITLFAVMDKGASMTVTPGTAKPRQVSLAGSTKATNAFRTCAGIPSSGAGGGTNPFANKP